MVGSVPIGTVVAVSRAIGRRQPGPSRSVPCHGAWACFLLTLCRSFVCLFVCLFCFVCLFSLFVLFAFVPLLVRLLVSVFDHMPAHPTTLVVNTTGVLHNCVFFLFWRGHTKEYIALTCI